MWKNGYYERGFNVHVDISSYKGQVIWFFKTRYKVIKFFDFEKSILLTLQPGA